MRQPDKDALESLIDAYGVREVMQELATLCFEKSEHIQSNWQDKLLASVWAQRGHKINALQLRATFKD